MVWLGRLLVGLGCSVVLGWMALAIYFDFSRLGPPWLRAGLGVLVPVGALVALWLVRPRRRALAGILGAFVVVLVTWLAIPPSNERDWQPDVATLAFADIHGDRVIVHNVRNAEYRTETDYTVRLEDRALDLSKLRSLDLFLVHWGSPLIAHTIMSWGFEGDRYLAISIETRKEKGEQYSALRGFFRQYELVFVVADERDVVRLRTNVRGEDVHVYRLDAPPADARALLLRYLEEVNQLRERPQWYNALTDNCTTAIQRLARVGRPPVVVELEALPERLPRRAGVRHRRHRSLPAVLRPQGEEPHQRAGQGRRRRPTILGPDPGRASSDVPRPRRGDDAQGWSGDELRRAAAPASARARLGALGLWRLAACAGPVGTVRVDPKVVHRHLGRSAITTGEPSLARRATCSSSAVCFEAFDERPEAAIAELHRAMVAAGGDPDLLFALAELSFLHGQATTKPDYHLAAAVYAYAFLFPEGPGCAPRAVRPAPADRGGSLQLGAHGEPSPRRTARRSSRGAARSRCPSGRSRWRSIPPRSAPGIGSSTGSSPTAELEVHGLAMRYRWPGLGAPLAASTRPIDASRPGRDLVAPRLQVPVTALLRIAEARHALVQGRPLAGTLELHLAWDAETVSIAGEPVPLENEPTAALALTFTGVPIMELELLGFLGRLTGLMRSGPRSSPPRRTVPGSSPWSSCTARSRAWSAGWRCTIVCWPIPRSAAASSSGSSSTIPASPSRCPLSTCARP